MSSEFGVGGSAFRTVRDRAMLTDTVAFPAYTRAIIDKAGPYDVELVRNQDDEYNYRLRELRAKILLTPDIQSKYHSRNSLRALCRQYYQYGFYKVRVMQKHPYQMRPRQFVPPLFVAGVIGGAVLGAIIPVVLQLWAGALILYTIVNVGFSAHLASQHGWSHLPRLLSVFLTLHMSYGLGFLAGLVRFARRWGKEKRN
jgi:succinoglycan biosynthesis protein ExoA